MATVGIVMTVILLKQVQEHSNTEATIMSNILTARLLLRAFAPANADDLHAYLSEPGIYQFEPGEPIDLAQARQMAQELAASPDFWRSNCKQPTGSSGRFISKGIAAAYHDAGTSRKVTISYGRSGSVTSRPAGVRSACFSSSRLTTSALARGKAQRRVTGPRWR